MKKKPPNPPKPKEFTTSPFKALKGAVKPVQPATTVPQAPPAPLPATPEENDEDMDLFLRAVSDVRPLETSPRGSAPAAGSSPTASFPRARLFEKEDTELFLKALEGMDVRFSADDDDDEDNPLRPISLSRMKQLKQGSIRIRLELDLHGLTRDEALDSLGHFIAGAWRRGIEAVLVITGKGNNSPGEPVLQSAVAGWLRDKGKKMVLEFSSAPRQMGGTGAFVVFLREPERGEP